MSCCPYLFLVERYFYNYFFIVRVNIDIETEIPPTQPKSRKFVASCQIYNLFATCHWQTCYKQACG